ncbi:MAG: PH domain-containing protein [Chitinophagaceae bacterium]
MDFLNEEIDPAIIPDAGYITWKPVERNYLLVLRVRWLLFSLVLLAAATLLILFIPSLQRGAVMYPVIAGTVLLVLAYFLLQERSFRTKAYAIRSHDLLYRHGWFIRSVEVCPFNRVQHCSLHSGPVERRYGLASLILYTAASDSGDLKIPGLPEATAAGLREFITQKMTGHDEATH